MKVPDAYRRVARMSGAELLDNLSQVEQDDREQDKFNLVGLGHLAEPRLKKGVTDHGASPVA